jgi:ketosteroid isomerase-like protein
MCDAGTPWVDELSPLTTPCRFNRDTEPSMKWTSNALFVGTLIASTFVTPSWSRDKQAEAAILSIEQAIVNARSVDQVVEYFDPQIVMYDFMPPTIRGLSAFVAHVKEVFAGMPSFDVRIREMHITADRELGFANSIQRVVVRDANGSVVLDGVFRNTNCYHKVNGRWLILDEHISFPVDLAAKKIVLDLDQETPK